ncbi:hypothetical protein AB0M36_20065 [Actinoplanes sp. NPDC051346]|uniref:hypothetical protein n=1 Tax=Actinoplanes sp. NPDC051346 TaxID=3155048 RepID=UPI0034315FC1
MTYPNDASLETPEADAVEQATEAVPGRFDSEDTEVAAGGEWNGSEQDRIVELEDDYR